MRTLLTAILALLFATLVAAQTKPKSQEECIKQVPGDWGPNFGDKWHSNEARYWACRNGVSVETVKEWQKAAEEEDAANDVKLVTIGGQKLVIFVEDSGTAHCYSLSVLGQPGRSWKVVWKLPSKKGDMEGYYCAGKCPALKAVVVGSTLVVRSATSSEQDDESCKHVTWQSERFSWNGATFVALKSDSSGSSGSSHQRPK